MRKRINLIYTMLFILPALTLFSIFLLNPIVQAVYMSFFKWKGVAGTKLIYAGITNYTKVLSNPQFWTAMRNSAILMAGGFLVLMPLAFILASIITSDIKGTRFYKTAFFMPVMLPITAVGLMWVYILEPNWGLINSLLDLVKLGGLKYAWLATPVMNVVVVTLVNEWIYAGFNMLIFASGLVAIPADLFEAATIDGATKTQRLRYITLPLCSESFKIFSVLCVTGCLKAFDLVFVMTKGGPNGTSEMPATFLYSQAFTFRNFGIGNAVGTIILVTGLIGSVLINKMLTRNDY